MGLNFSQHSEEFEHCVWRYSTLSFWKDCFKAIFREQNEIFEKLLTNTENNNISHRNDHFKQESCCVNMVRN